MAISQDNKIKSNSTPQYTYNFDKLTIDNIQYNLDGKNLVLSKKSGTPDKSEIFYDKYTIGNESGIVEGDVSITGTKYTQPLVLESDEFVKVRIVINQSPISGQINDIITHPK